MTAWQPAIYGDDDQPTGDLAGGAYISMTRIILLAIADHTGFTGYTGPGSSTTITPEMKPTRFGTH